jgi:HAD superfamily phosphatase (TIGR01681 family)
LGDQFVGMKNFAQLKKNLKEDFINLKVIKVAILADTATQLLKQALEGRGYDKGYNVKIWQAAFQQTELQVFTQTSELYGFEPEFVIIFHSSHKLLSKYSKLGPDQYTLLAANELKLIHNIHSTISNRLNGKTIYYNYPEIDDSVFGNFSNKIESSFLFQLRKLNYELMLFAAQNSNFHICDISTIQNRIGKHNFFHPATYINTEMVLSIDALPAIASKTVDLISVLNGSLKKCLILDLDNTLWGGVIGDDGLEKIEIGSLGIGKAYTEFQYWIKKLKNRGIILAVCSKNYESVAKEPFKKHPDMILQLDDFSIFVANWENKVDNIRHIQKVLNIGFDSMVFIDDNPFERNLVREQLTEVTVPELPEDPADYLEYLYSLNLFETASFSEEESGRSKLYQLAAERTVVQRSFTNEDEFLQSLGMIALVESFNAFNTPRVA